MSHAEGDFFFFFALAFPFAGYAVKYVQCANSPKLQRRFETLELEYQAVRHLTVT